MPERKGIVVLDLDGTICEQTSGGAGGADGYRSAKPIVEVIRRINELWTDGWTIVIYTARGMASLEWDVAAVKDSLGQLTTEWLARNRVCYDKLVFGKPPGDCYVDDKALRPDEFLRDLPIFAKDI